MSRATLLVLLALAAPASAQELSFRAGAGPAYAGAAGAAVHAGLVFEQGRFHGRVEAHGVATGASADWDGSARLLALGLAAGPVDRAGRYLLAAAGTGLDPREADRATSFGAIAGAPITAGGRLFAELRYERWLQHGVRHHELPEHLFAAAFGFTVR